MYKESWLLNKGGFGFFFFLMAGLKSKCLKFRDLRITLTSGYAKDTFLLVRLMDWWVFLLVVLFLGAESI